MKTIYLVIGLSEERVVKDASLGSSGIHTDTEHFILGKLVAKTTDYLEAVKIASEKADEYELGIRIDITLQSTI